MAVSASARPPLLRRRFRFGACFALAAATFGVGCWLDVAPARAQTNLLQFPDSARTASEASERRATNDAAADARAGDRDPLRLHEQARLRGRQRPDLLRRLDPRSRQGHLRPDDQAAARRGQRPPDRARRQDHLWRDHEPQRRLPRRFRRFAAARHCRIRPAWRRPAPTAPAATSPSSRAASTPPASRARTIRRSRRCGRSRPRASSTTKARR